MKIEKESGTVPMKPIVIIFDMDGVIIDSEHVYQEIERGMLHDIGVPFKAEEHLKFQGTSERSMWQYMKSQYGFKEDPSELVMQERDRFLARLQSPEGIPPVEGIEELLNKLSDKDIPCLIASSSSREIIDAVIEKLKIRKYFSGIVSGDDVKLSKPAPDIFLKASKLAKVTSSDCIVIEDSENGVLAARSAGMQVIALNILNSNKIDLSAANKVVQSLVEAGRVIQNSIE
jgi:HAD superfamily hydrolase (TIGR01509 family)